MKRRVHASRALAAGLAIAFWLAAVAGCNDNQLGAQKRRPNRSPETILSSGPPDSTYGTSYKVHLFWSGSDADGTIDHYDFILVDHPAGNDSIAARDPNYAHTVAVTPPEPNDPRWTATTANDTIIVSLADTLRHAPPVRPSQNDSVRTQSFERWHTFFVRAVDNEGAMDLTPQYRSFNSTTLAPDVWLLPPVDPLQEKFTGPRVIVFNWAGNDPVGDGSDLQPIAARWVKMETSVTTTGDYVGYPDSLYRLAPSRWNAWKRWDARDKSGRQAIVKGLIPTSEPGHGFYLFAVQAMDEAGAVTPVFDAKTPGKNNVARIWVNDEVGAGLVVNDKFLGTFNFASASGARPTVLDMAAGQPVKFKWRGDASYYGGSIVAYRYGWNIRTPSNDDEWQQNWCETCTSADERRFNSGNQRFFLEARDNAETITHAEFELVVRQVTRSKDLLLVDDSTYPPDDRLTEAREDQRWLDVIDSLRARQPFRFDRNEGGDVYDVEVNRRLPPPLSRVFDYKTVVWTARAYSDNALKKLAYFFDPYAPRNQMGQASFNYLNIYIENGGEFWLTGEDVGYVLWPISEAPITPDNYQLPANITNWDDPVQPHPDIDSAGVTGFLWKLGVEAVDVGAGGKAPPRSGRRDRLEHACMGFRRATPPGWEQQTFTSTVAQHHSHALTLQTQDVIRPPAAGVTYTTDIPSDHTHTMFVSAAALRRLAGGESVVDSTDVNALPAPHRHYYTLVDQVGLWGAPATLERDMGLWPAPPLEVNRLGGRYNVEIFNMTKFMDVQTPALRPEPGISVVLYTYISGVPENPDTGMLYPATADGQPSVLLRRAQSTSPAYSRAICGFEAWRLKASSHLALANFILLRHFRLGLPD
jgi:hypothetical protein